MTDKPRARGLLYSEQSWWMMMIGRDRQFWKPLLATWFNNEGFEKYSRTYLPIQIWIPRTIHFTKQTFVNGWFSPVTLSLITATASREGRETVRSVSVHLSSTAVQSIHGGSGGVGEACHVLFSHLIKRMSLPTYVKSHNYVTALLMLYGCLIHTQHNSQMNSSLSGQSY